MRCKLLREVDPNHDVYVGPVGMWVPFHPDAYKTGRVEYMEETLNQLMSEKKKNEDNAKKEFDKRVKEAKEKAINENKKNAEKSGNKLTQTINSKGELVSVKNLSTEDEDSNANAGEDEEESENATLDEIRKQMFETENVVIDKNTDHGLSRLTENQVSGVDNFDIDRVD
jgi:vacuolar-type H+-ATPase subunit I/STV1